MRGFFYQMEAEDIVEEFPLLLNEVQKLRSWDNAEYKVKLYWDSLTDEDLADPIFSSSLLKLKVYLFDYGRLLNEYNIYFYSDGRFYVDRPLYDKGYLVPSPINAGPSIEIWKCVLQNWLGGFVERKRQISRTLKLKQELLLRSLITEKIETA